MKHTNFRRGLAGLLATLTLVQGCTLTALAAEVEAAPVTEQAVTLAEPQLQNGTAVIPAGADEETVKQALFDALVVNKDQVDAQSLEWEFYGTSASDPWSLWDESRWVSVLDGGNWTNKHGLITYKYNVKPLSQLGEGNYQVRLAGTTTDEVTLNRVYQLDSSYTLNEDSYEVGMVYAADGNGYDYDATAEAIYNAVVASTEPTLTAAEVTVEYNADPTSFIDVFKPLNYTDLGGLVKFDTGTWEIKLSWGGNDLYKGWSEVVNVTTTDNRAESSVALKSGVSFTYNMNADVMKQAILDNVIDWDNSTLPAKDTLTADNFVIEYYGEAVLFDGGIDSGIKGWAPIEGKKYEVLGQVLGQFPQMGAGENQHIRVSFLGSADYRPSSEVESTVTVNKAKVSVKVNSTNLYAGEALSADFITTDPADDFDIYTIYAGVTSNVTTALYLDLPERYTDSAFLELIDGALALAGQKTLTQMMQDGVTVGELREIFSTQALLDVLDKLNIDTGTFGKILETINSMPGILDSVRVAFGEPTNRAGLYTVAAVTDNQNYETGVGIGFLLVKMRFSGPKLTWNQEIQNGKLTAEQAKTFNFGATLLYEGVAVEDQSSVSYLYSGFTSKWRVYSSTTTPPTEPGSYVVTVCILGGNYMAAPITRSFTITK